MGFRPLSLIFISLTLSLFIVANAKIKQEHQNPKKSLPGSLKPTVVPDTEQSESSQNELPVVAQGNILAKMETYFGDVYIELYKEQAPNAVNHFIKFIDEGFYNGLIFHRIIDGFIIQGGAYQTNFIPRTSALVSKLSYLPNNIRNSVGSLSFAHHPNDPDSVTTQFFINLSDNFELDPQKNTKGYVVFGKVLKGLDIVSKIARIKIGQREGAHNTPFYPKEAEIKYMQIIDR